MQQKNNLSRRDFLKGAAVTGATVAGVGLLAGCGSAEESAAGLPEEWGEEVDVVVVGSGFAALSAAIEAHNGGAVSYVGSPLQKEKGIEDSPDLMYQDMLVAGLYFNYPEQARMVAEKCGEAVQWTIDYLGVEYTDTLVQFGGHSVQRSYSTKQGTGYGIIQKALEKVDELGVDLSLDSKVTQVFKDESGRVVGVEFEDQNSLELKTVRAKKAVVLGSGGFGQDIAFRQTQDPRLTEGIDCTNHSGATAEMLKYSLGLGALPVQLANIQLGPWASPDEKGFGLVPWFSVPAGSPWGVIVDPETGTRFVNELTDRKRKADAILAVGHPTINICDSVGFGRIPPSWDVKPAVEKGIIFKADSLEEIAQHFDMPVDAFIETIENYNSYVADGMDPEFDKPIPSTAEPIATGPFYAARLWPKVHHCMGGIATNPSAQVLDLDGNVIPGFYAAGEVAGGIHGATRLGSASTADCLVFGRIAGQNAAKETAAEA